MHQRQPIRIDKGRAFSEKNGPVSSSTQVSFHKIYRKKRCYSLVDKEQEGYGGRQWKAGHVNPQRDNNGGLQSSFSSGSCSVKPTRRINSIQSNDHGNYSVSPPNRESARNYHQQSKRSNDRVGFNLVSGPEFDVPFVKKQKVENYMSPALQHSMSPERGHDKQKMALDDTKWMYKNQHAKMSGPYGVRQLMEGFYAHFLQEDLPVYQFREGKLGRPIMLKQLIDDLESCNSLMHDPARHSDEPFSEECCHQVACPHKIDKDMDLPPGFGGHSAQFSETPSCIYRLNSSASTAAPTRSVGAFSSSSPDFGVEESGLPPGFEAVASTASLREPQHMPELQRSSRKFSAGAGLAVRSEAAERMELGYEKFEPVVHGRNRSSHPGSSPHSKVSFTMQGAKSLSGNPTQLEPIVHSQGHLCQQGSSPHSKSNFTLQGAKCLNENSSRHTTWAFASPNTGVSNIEAQMFSSPTVCIGLPVSKPAVQSWPAGNNLSMTFAQANNGMLGKEYREFSVMHGVTSLDLVHSELLTAVKRSYVKTVLSALIDEQLQCWIDGKDTTVKSLLPEDGSCSREASSWLPTTEFGVVCVESSTLQTDTSTSLAKHHVGLEEIPLQGQAVQSPDGSCLNACVGSAEISFDPRDGHYFDGSGLTNQFICTGEHQCLSAKALSRRNDDGTCTYCAMTDVKPPRDTEQKSLGTSEVLFLKKSAEIDLGKVDSLLSCDESSTLSVKSSSLLDNSFDNAKQIVVNQREEVQQQSEEEILQEDGAVGGKIQSSGNTSDALYLETQPSFLVSGKKKWKIKSLKHLMQITSKLRPRHLKVSPSMSQNEEMSLGMVPETSVQNGMPIPKDYDGCARTAFGGWLWCELVRHAPHSESFQRDCNAFCTYLNKVTAQTRCTQLGKFLAPADGSFVAKLTGSETKLKLARSKIHEWGVFAVEPLEAGDFVIEYVGEVIRPRVSDIRERNYRTLGIGSSFLLHVDEEMVVDATKRGGVARFMNYSCDPNCYTKIVMVENSRKVCIYAKRHIISGEELTYDYKFQLEDQKIPCNCRSARCRNFQIDECK